MATPNSVRPVAPKQDADLVRARNVNATDTELMKIAKDSNVSVAARTVAEDRLVARLLERDVRNKDRGARRAR